MRADRHCLMSDGVCLILSIKLVSHQTNMRLVISICFGKFAGRSYDDDNDNMIMIVIMIVMTLI